jgi:hypothetical protein
MEGSLEEIVQSLSHACAFPVSVDDVTVRQTHISVVFLSGELVYKIKKPVKLSFLDFSTVELRQHFCEEEVRINRPWAPDVYLGVVPITRDADGLRFEGNGPVIDWAVKMRRLSFFVVGRRTGSLRGHSTRRSLLLRCWKGYGLCPVTGFSVTRRRWFNDQKMAGLETCMET